MAGQAAGALAGVRTTGVAAVGPYRSTGSVGGSGLHSCWCAWAAAAIWGAGVGEAQLKAQQVYEQTNRQAVWSLAVGLGAAVSEGVNLPRLLTTLALAIAGAFLLVGERKGENLPSESRIMMCATT